MKIIIITIFPNLIKEFLNYGIIKKIILKKLINIKILDLKKFSNKKVDNYSYGGDRGMVISCEPLFNSIKKSKKILGKNFKIIYLSPQGKILNNNYLNYIIKMKNIVLICGRYEGIDKRMSKYIDFEISIGNYILSGGEIPSMVLLESISRLIPNALNNVNSITNDSFSKKFLDHDHYTKPKKFMNMHVPKILLSGNHKKIKLWRLKNSIGNTWIKKPELIKSTKLNDLEKKLLEEFKKEYKIEKNNKNEKKYNK